LLDEYFMTTSVQHISANTLVVFDFETTGLSPDMGDRAIEIGAVLIESGRITDRFQQLMNPGIKIPYFIENLTGITNGMIAEADKNAQVMADFHEFIQGHNLVAHNASFDERFLRAEFKRIKKPLTNSIACSLLTARRVLPLAPNHQLQTLAEYKQLPMNGQYHRALADAEVTAHLWLSLLDELSTYHQFPQVPFEFMLALGKTPRHQLVRFYREWRQQLTAAEVANVQ
jgi:DNA polymerase-3 subunit epsilon